MKPIFFLYIFFSSLVAKSQIPIDHGHAMLDLNNWNAQEKKIITLDCKWDFYWKKFLGPHDFNKKTLPQPDSILKPSAWGSIKLNKNYIGGKGFATYRLTLLNLPKKDLILDANSMQTAFRVFLNEKLVTQVGIAGKDKLSTVPFSKDVQIRIPANSQNVDIIIQVANFHHRKGGFVEPFQLGEAKAMIKQKTLFYYLDILESTALAIIGLFLFALFIFRRKDLSILYFSLFCLTLCFKPIISVNFLFTNLFPDISWSLLLRMEYLSILFPCLFMLLFMKQLFRQQLPARIEVILRIIFILKIIAVLILPPAIFSFLIIPVLFIIPIAAIIFAITIIKGVMGKVEGANYAGAGITVLMCSLVLKVLVYSGIIASVHILITVLDIGFIFMMSLILGSRFSLQFARVEALQKKTEIQAHEIERKKEMVEEKNKEILDSIKYAKRIQDALLPSEKYIDRNLGKSNKL